MLTVQNLSIDLVKRPYIFSYQNLFCSMITDVINDFSFKFGLMVLCCVNQSTDLFGVSLGVAKLIICNSQMRKYKYLFVFIETV